MVFRNRCFFRIRNSDFSEFFSPMNFDVSSRPLDIDQVKIRIKPAIRTAKRRPNFTTVDDFKDCPNRDKRNQSLPTPTKHVPPKKRDRYRGNTDLKNMAKPLWARTKGRFSIRSTEGAKERPNLGGPIVPDVRCGFLEPSERLSDVLTQLQFLHPEAPEKVLPLTSCT